MKLLWGAGIYKLLRNIFSYAYWVWRMWL
jgi:hypothetical protein